MSWLDLILVIILAFFVLSGLRRGLVREIIDISAVLATLVLAGNYGQYVGAKVATALGWDTNLASLVGFICIAIGVALVASAIVLIWSHLGNVPPLSIIDRLGGGLIGLAKASLLILAFLVILTSLPMESSTALLSQSPMALSFMRVLPVVYEVLGSIWPEHWPKLYVNPEGWWLEGYQEQIHV